MVGLIWSEADGDRHGQEFQMYLTFIDTVLSASPDSADWLCVFPEKRDALTLP